jgi:hypothetical protein
MAGSGLLPISATAGVTGARATLASHSGNAIGRAPSGPPLTSVSGAASGEGAQAEASQPTAGDADPLIDNGLGSPLCRGALGGGLSGVSRRDCETSGFIAAPAPTGDYGIDVHIETGLLGLTSGGLLSAVQDLFVTPLWMALVWAVHALVVMLEWCYTIDLLDSSAGASIGRGLRQMQSALTGPWLAVVLAVASVLAAYNGLVRRRVAETVGEAIVLLAMMAAGLWVIFDPTGTVGALGGWANQASLGTLAVTARGTPSRAGRALADSMQAVFAAAIEAPWCYLEFGDVDWCREPARLDPRLRNVGLRIAAGEQVLVSCKLQAGLLSLCVPAASAQGQSLEHSAQLLRAASSNGAIFLALPANGPARNSISDQDSLLRALCQSSEANSCRGPTAAQAEFRTAGNTWSRVGGLLLIVAGVVGMLLLLGFIVVRLLAAALFSLLYLLLAPAAVLAPALGDDGRAAFRKWATRLLGAVVAKLMYSFLLGVVLAVGAVLGELRGLGWWTQWLLTSVFWWGAFARRHQALGLAEGAIGRERSQHRRSLARRVSEVLETPRAVWRQTALAKSKLTRPAPNVEQPRGRAQLARARAGEVADAQVARSLEREHREASALVASGPDAQARLADMRVRLARVRDAGERARTAGEPRRAAALGARGQRIQGELARQEGALAQARRTVASGESARRRTGELHTREQREERARWLDAQAALPAAGRASSAGERRDYPALAGLAGHGRREYEQLDPVCRREARMQIDRELALRKELDGAVAQLAPGGDPRGTLQERRKAGTEFDHVLGERMRKAGHRSPNNPAAGSPLDQWKREALAAAARRHTRANASPVLDDAREVAARRKRQLGRDRP